jgi:hypothetical protein
MSNVNLRAFTTQLDGFVLKRSWQLQIGIEIEREGCATKHNGNLHSLNGHSTAKDGYANRPDLSELDEQ